MNTLEPDRATMV